MVCSSEPGSSPLTCGSPGRAQAARTWGGDGAAPSVHQAKWPSGGAPRSSPLRADKVIEELLPPARLDSLRPMAVVVASGEPGR